jgi:hypothetical protein
MNRPAIPEATKRAVRQRCGFGCVICGLPIFDYEHIDDWAQTYTHHPDNLTLLCPEHHRQKTSGLLSRDAVRRATARPFNRGRSATRPHRFGRLDSSKEFRVNLGSNTIVFPSLSNVRYDLLVIDCVASLTLSCQDDQLLLSVTFFDGNGSPILNIADGEVVLSLGVWDFTLIGKLLTIRTGSRSVALQLAFGGTSLDIRKANILGALGTRLTFDQQLFTVQGAKASASDHAFLRNNFYHSSAVVISPDNTVGFGTLTPYGVVASGVVRDSYPICKEIASTFPDIFRLSYLRLARQTIAKSAMETAVNLGFEEAIWLAGEISDLQEQLSGKGNPADYFNLALAYYHNYADSGKISDLYNAKTHFESAFKSDEPTYDHLQRTAAFGGLARAEADIALTLQSRVLLKSAAELLTSALRRYAPYVADPAFDSIHPGTNQPFLQKLEYISAALEALSGGCPQPTTQTHIEQTDEAWKPVPGRTDFFMSPTGKQMLQVVRGANARPRL